MGKKNFIDFISERTRCIDGAMGTMLFKSGFQSGGCPELAPAEMIKKIHKSYLDAGAEIIITNTFGANRPKLEKYGLADRLKEINRRNAQIACEIEFDEEFYVAGGLGPTGEFIEPYGEYTYAQFLEIFSEQVEALDSAGVDLIIIETMTAIEEFQAAIESAKKTTSLPVVACMAFNKNPNGFFTMMGVSPLKMVQVAQQSGADIVGANCSLNPETMVELCEELVHISELPVIVEPNAGDPKLINGNTVYEPIPNLPEYLRRMVKLGVSIIGGCCGTDPQYISTLRKIVEQEYYVV